MKLPHLFIVGIVFVASVPARAQSTEQEVSQIASQGSSSPESAQNAPQQTQSTKETENPPEPESHGTRLRWQDIPGNVVHDQKSIFLSPLHIDRNNAKWWIVLGAGTAALIATDQTVSNNLPQHTSLTTPSKWASRIGAEYSIYPLWATFYLVGKAGDNPRARDTGRIGIEALIDADITASVLKLITQRPRPETKGQSVAFFSGGGDAFPSGHSIKAWALARVASREFPEPKFVPILAYGVASAVSIARVGGRRHSPSDAFAGAAMGFFIGDFVYRHHHSPSEKSKALSWVADHMNVGFNVGR
jgi:membrane-associated phospholipid phosphatase